jgi:WD40 repeat protein
MFLVALLAAAVFHAQTPSPTPSATNVSELTLAAPQTIAEIDAGKLTGEPGRLAWSPDGSQFYLQTVERDKRGNVKSAKHYLISTADKSVKKVDLEPAWASKYWVWKSDKASPAAPAFTFTVDKHEEVKRAVSAPTGGDLARGGTDVGGRGGSGTSVSDAAAAAYASQPVIIYTLRLKGAGWDWPVGEWSNEAVTPGLNYTWAPAPLHAIAYAKRGGGPLVLLDDAGHRQELKGAKAAVLPAWADDGKRIAWLERKDKKKYDLMVAEVSLGKP